LYTEIGSAAKKFFLHIAAPAIAAVFWFRIAAFASCAEQSFPFNARICQAWFTEFQTSINVFLIVFYLWHHVPPFFSALG
jgi:hypothetical protein